MSPTILMFRMYGGQTILDNVNKLEAPLVT